MRVCLDSSKTGIFFTGDVSVPSKIGALFQSALTWWRSRSQIGKPFSMLRTLSLLISAATLMLSASIAHAWGQLKDLNEPTWTKTFLAPILQERSQIRYCLEIDPSVASRFPQESLIIQIEAVYQEWLAPVRAKGLVSDVTISKVSCKSRDFDVKIAIGPDAKYPNIGAYQIESQQDGRWFSLVKLNTNYKSTAPDEIVDIKSLLDLRSLSAVSSLMVKFETTPSLNVKTFAHENDQLYGPMFWTSYRVLLHEMGHAFGLCDTLESIAHDHCDRAYLTPIFKNSVMSDSNFLSLTDDDRDGIVALFRRFAVPATSPASGPSIKPMARNP